MRVLFFIFVEGAMIFFKFNHFCWQKWVLNVLNIFKLRIVIGDSGFLI
jgi:hypothetical protein